MKKLMLLTAIIFFMGFNGLVAQDMKINPIPSFNYPLNGEKALFQERKSNGNSTKEKRDMDIVVSSASQSLQPVFATVWVVKNLGSVVLGPFTVNDNEKLSIGIDNGTWGVMINSEYDVNVSVWIE